MTTTTMTAQWGESTITIAADFAQAAAPISGLEGLQVADVRHSANEAMWKAVERAAKSDGASHVDDCDTDRDGYDETCALCLDIAKAVDAAKRQ